MNLKTTIDDAVTKALRKAGAKGSPAVVKPAARAEFGHYQANGVMGAAKKLGMNPRELAARVIESLDLPQAASTEIAGPGFINIHLDPAYLAAELARVRRDAMLGVVRPARQTIVVDYSAPNLAKEMHIGHLRTTAIGDAIVRISEFLGHNVIRVNHVGDWGAQFGRLLAYLDELDAVDTTTELKDLEKFYQHASTRASADPAFAARAREYVVRLQGGDARCLALWQTFIETSINHCQAVYDKMDITLTRADLAPESSYNDKLPVLIEDLRQKGILVESDGALCVFLDEFKGKDGKPLPAIIRKSDGGYPYMATDLAAVQHRTQTLHADKALYVVGAPQTLHFQQVFAVARAAGYLDEKTDFRHLPFGNILRPDGKMFKTREGADVKLSDVADEAVTRARELVAAKNPDLSDSDKDEISRVVGIGAMKYAELSKNRTTDYIFDWNTMLSFEGNTAPYLQYAYTRIRSVFKRAGVDADSLEGDITLTHENEIALAMKLLQFPEALEAVTEDYQSNVLCGYLYELSGIFMAFYEQCPILKADDATRTSRLLLSDVAAKILKQGLGLLGISTVEQM